MHRRSLLLMALAIVATAGVVALIGQAAHFGTLVSRLNRAEFAWLLVCGLGQVISYLGYITCYQAIARLGGGPHIPTGVVLRAILLAFGAFSVASTVGGLSVDFWVLREAGESGTRASARVIALETLRWTVLALATCVASVLVLLGVAQGDEATEADLEELALRDHARRCTWSTRPATSRRPNDRSTSSTTPRSGVARRTRRRSSPRGTTGTRRSTTSPTRPGSPSSTSASWCACCSSPWGCGRR